MNWNEVNISNLTEESKGREVVYYFSTGDSVGLIYSWNSMRIFVKFPGSPCPMACDPDQLKYTFEI